MSSIFVREAIAFAIEKEQEAVDFYKNLAEKFKSPELKQEILKFSDMEMVHKERLENLDFSNMQFNSPKEDLKIADYMVGRDISSDMSYEDLIAIAMERELMSQRLYEDLAKITPDPDVKAIFNQLALEEANHKNYFEKIWDSEVLTEN